MTGAAGYCSANPQGLIVEANLGIATLLGVSRGSLLNQPIDRFVFPEDADAFYRAAPRAGGDGSAGRLELRLLPHAGMPRWVQVSATHWSDEAGAAALLYLVLTDIGERKQAEFALRDSEVFGRAIIDSVIAEIAVLDRQGTIIRVQVALAALPVGARERPGRPAPRTGVRMTWTWWCAARVRPRTRSRGRSARGSKRCSRASPALHPRIRLRHAAEAPGSPCTRPRSVGTVRAPSFRTSTSATARTWELPRGERRAPGADPQRHPGWLLGLGFDPQRSLLLAAVVEHARLCRR